MRKYKKAGLNTVQTYAEWSLHEPRKGQFDFAGDNDLFRFIELAQKHDLLVILRVGWYSDDMKAVHLIITLIYSLMFPLRSIHLCGT